MNFDPYRPFNDLPLLPPAKDVETKAILKKSISANRTLAELKVKSRSMPNPSMLINSITLQEAKDSSEIENIITTTDSLYKAISSEKELTDPATKEVLMYREALWEGYNSLAHKPLSTNTYVRMVETIRKTNIGIRNQSGTKIVNPRTNEIIYSPPEGEELIRRLLNNLDEYINTMDDGVDPLIKMAVIHYQFVSIHPFTDGNGRTGRILNILYLVNQGLLDLPVLYLSRYFIKNRNEYYLRLREVTEQNRWEEWILFVLEGIERTSKYTIKVIDDILDLINETVSLARKTMPERVYSKELIELIFEQPYCKGKFLVDRGIAMRQTAAEYLKELERVGILESRKSGRENLYLNKKLYALLSRM